MSRKKITNLILAVFYLLISVLAIFDVVTGKVSRVWFAGFEQRGLFVWGLILSAVVVLPWIFLWKNNNSSSNKLFTIIGLTAAIMAFVAGASLKNTIFIFNTIMLFDVLLQIIISSSASTKS